MKPLRESVFSYAKRKAKLNIAINLAKMLKEADIHFWVFVVFNTSK